MASGMGFFLQVTGFVVVSVVAVLSLGYGASMTVEFGGLVAGGLLFLLGSWCKPGKRK
ncbi:MAG: hypothetical protein VX916_02750 [Planctomycetota bacterium]|nr:hypothetical protein [Planctomycetota bacterium]